jgi:hypothetical protein
MRCFAPAKQDETQNLPQLLRGLIAALEWRERTAIRSTLQGLETRNMMRVPI